jgi:hypothetical protein
MATCHMGRLALFAVLAWAGAASAQTPTPPAEPPASFAMAGRAAVLAVHGVGAQIYECKAGSAGLAWTFREPIAGLFKDGQSMGRHYAGPTWALLDGSLIKGKQAASAPGATAADVAWLKLDVVQNAGTGALKDATTVLRLNTQGGALAGPCPTAGALRAEPYAADYVFLR